MAVRRARHGPKHQLRGSKVALLEYSTLFSALTLLGLFVFGSLSAYYFGFYGQLGLTPSNVGLAQGEVLARAAYWLGSFVLAMLFLFALLASFLLVVVELVRLLRRRLNRPPPQRTYRVLRQARRFLPPAECWVFAVLVYVNGVIEPTQAQPLLDAAIVLVLFWPIAYVLGRVWGRRRISVVIFSLLCLGLIVFTLSQQGQKDAARLEGTGVAGGLSGIMGVEHVYAFPQFAREVAPRGYDQGRMLLLLGSGNDDTYALYDCAEQQVYRVYTGQVTLHVLAPQPDPQKDQAFLADLQCR